MRLSKNRLIAPGGGGNPCSRRFARRGQGSCGGVDDRERRQHPRYYSPMSRRTSANVRGDPAREVCRESGQLGSARTHATAGLGLGTPGGSRLDWIEAAGWLGLSPRKFGSWKGRYGKANEHNAMIPRDHWVEPQERNAIEAFARQYPLEGYRRLTFMMLDRDVAAVSPATTYRVLKAAGAVTRVSPRIYILIAR